MDKEYIGYKREAIDRWKKRMTEFNKDEKSSIKLDSKIRKKLDDEAVRRGALSRIHGQFYKAGIPINRNLS